MVKDLEVMVKDLEKKIAALGWTSLRIISDARFLGIKLDASVYDASTDRYDGIMVISDTLRTECELFSDSVRFFYRETLAEQLEFHDALVAFIEKSVAKIATESPAILRAARDTIQTQNRIIDELRGK